MEDTARLSLDRIVFLHVPKSGGTTLRKALRQGWRRMVRVGATRELPRAVAKAAAMEGGCNIMAGHFRAFALDTPMLADYTPVTVLRDPVRRLLSFYAFAHVLLRSGKPMTSPFRYATQVTFPDFAFSAHGLTELHATVFQLGLNEEPARWVEPLSQVHARAAERLRTMRAGTTEAMQAFCDGLFREAGRRRAPVLQHFKANVDPSEDGGLTRAQRSMLEELAGPGRALHRQAEEQMQAWLDRLGGTGRRVRRGRSEQPAHVEA